MKSNLKIREELRELALKFKEITNNPIMSKRRELWLRHNQLQNERPPVLVSPLCWKELIPEKDYVTNGNDQFCPVENYLSVITNLIP